MLLNAAGLVGYFALLGTGMLAARRSLPLVGPSLNRLGNALKSSKAVTATASLLLVACPLLFVTLELSARRPAARAFPGRWQRRGGVDRHPRRAAGARRRRGEPTALLGELGRWMPFNDREIELVVVTHPGDERLGGLLGLAQRYRIGQVVQAPFPYPSAAYG